ncbi:MAG: PrsW family intramembrane metalloprotease [Bacteroidales bacterium]|nr:PrsW family intramembrane metalloprotease [Bacteroidales bacterium]
MNLIFILATLPVALILIYIYRKDVNKEPIRKLIVAFLAGCVTVIPAMIMELILQPFSPGTPILGGLFDGFVVAGFSEELSKLALLMLVIWRSNEFSEYFDGIVYAVFVSMGFAGIENLLYVFSPDSISESISTAIVRAIISVPGHFLFAVAMGYYLSLAKFDPAHRSNHLIKALFYPVMLHGTFDAILMVSDGLSAYEGLTYMVGAIEFVVFVIFDIKLWKKGLKRIKQMQEMSRRQDYNPMNPFENFRWEF